MLEVGVRNLESEWPVVLPDRQEALGWSVYGLLDFSRSAL